MMKSGPPLIDWIDTVSHSSWWPVLLPLGYGIIRLGEYLLRRMVEGKPTSEKIDHYSKLADLQEKLEKTGMTIRDLDELRSEMITGEADNKIVVATQYAEAARQLVSGAREVESRLHGRYARSDWDKGLSQFELNVISAQKSREAENELASVVMNLMQSRSPEEVLLLQRSQDAWKILLNAEAEREGKNWEGGSIRSLMMNARVEAMTRERIASLRIELSGPNGSELKIRKSHAPRNLLDHVKPGVPKQRILDILGTPTYVHGDRWYYRYEEAQIEIFMGDNICIVDVIIALCHGYIYQCSNLVTELPLGRLTLADLLQIDPQAVVEYRTSMRTAEVYVCIRTGPPGAWTDYSFGSLKIFSGAGGLQDTDFEWDHEAGALVTNPKDVIINWMALPGSIDLAPFFSWFIE